MTQQMNTQQTNTNPSQNTIQPGNVETGSTTDSGALTLTADGAGGAGSTAARTYEVRTFGSQMNVHDSERLS
ncbi:MAG: hypothetical protein GX898_06715, partial [Corynebacterium sp.]|nr:hypothetical protein [Corynebacterium sp.]